MKFYLFILNKIHNNFLSSYLYFCCFTVRFGPGTYIDLHWGHVLSLNAFLIFIIKKKTKINVYINCVWKLTLVYTKLQHSMIKKSEFLSKKGNLI